MTENSAATSTSLRARLLRWLLLPGLMLAFGLLAKNYLTVSEMANRIQDRLLVALAVTISEHAINSRGDLLSRDIELLLEQFTRENTYYRVQGPDGAFVTGDSGLPRLPDGITLEPGVPHFYNAHYRNEDVRAVTMKYLVSNPSSNIYGWVTIDVSQTRRERDNLIYEELLGSTFGGEPFRPNVADCVTGSTNGDSDTKPCFAGDGLFKVRPEKRRRRDGRRQ